MNYAFKFSHAENPFGAIIEDGMHFLFKVPSVPKPCWNCDRVTVFFDLNLWIRLCSTECCFASWKKYIEQIRKMKEWQQSS